MKDERMPAKKNDDPVSSTGREPGRPESCAGRREVKMETEERTPEEEAGYGYGV